MTQDLKTRIENIYALDRERTQGEWTPHEYLARKGCKPEDNEVVMVWTDLPERTIAECVLRKNSKFLAAAPEMVDIIRSLEAKVESYAQLLKDIAKDYEGLATAADANNLVRTAKDARETIAHITKILTKERLNE